MSNQRTKGRLAMVIAVLVFLAGGAVGVAIDRLVWNDDGGQELRRQRPDAQSLTARYQARLSLDAEQTERVREILERSFAEADALMERFDPEMTAIRYAANQRVSAVLRDDQASAFAEIVREQEERRAAFRRKSQPSPSANEAPPDGP